MKLICALDNYTGISTLGIIKKASRSSSRTLLTLKQKTIHNLMEVVDEQRSEMEIWTPDLRVCLLYTSDAADE